MSKGKSLIKQTCPYHTTPTVKLANQNHIQYDVHKSKDANRAMRDINNLLRDKVLSYDPSQINYEILDYNTIAQKSRQHNNAYPGHYDDIIPLNPENNSSNIITQLQSSESYSIQKIVARHKFHYQNTQSHSKSAEKVILEITKQMGQFSLENLNKVEEDELFLYQSIQERPETETPIRLFNEMIQSRPDIVKQILKIQSQLCTVLQELILEDEQLELEQIAFSEIGFVENNKVYPNSRFMKVLTNNYGQFFHQYRDKLAEEILHHSSIDAENARMFNQSLFVFEKNEDKYALKEIDNRACPAVRSIGPMVRHLSPCPA